MTRLHLASVGLLCLLALAAASTPAKKAAPHHPSNETAPASSKEAASTAVSTRKERLNVLNGFSNGLLGMLGSNAGGGSSATGVTAGGSGGLGGIQQGLKGIQAIQKFVTRFQDIVKMPFSFRGLTDSMATMTGLLAAVGGGYLTYVTMVGLFGSMLDPQNTAYQHAYSAPPHQYAAPGQYAYSNLQAAGQQAQVQGYNRRQSSDHGGLHIGSLDLGKVYQTVANFNYPEASFKLLRIKDEACKQRAVCELEKFLAKKGIASVILKGVSKKITGMDKYLEAAYRGLSNEECGYVYSSCPSTLGQTLLRSVGLN